MKFTNVLQKATRFLACLILIGTLLAPLVRAESNPSPWLAGAPEYTKLADVGVADLAPNMVSNRDCQLREAITRTGRILPIPQAKQSHTACVADTAYGALPTGSYLQRPGSSVFGQVKTHLGGTTQLMPIPYSSTGLVITGGTSNGSYLFFDDNLDKTLSTSVIHNGEVVHRLPPSHTARLNDKAGNALIGNTDSISFSVTGEWMVLDIPFVATVRVNTVTREVLPFGNSVNYNIGLGPGFRTTISADGRYAAVSSANFGILKVYDLSTCGLVPTIITTKVPCSSRDLLPLMRQNISNFGGITGMRFRSGYTLDMYAFAQSAGTTTKYSRHLLTAAGQQATGFQYLALGDSFASGEGAYQYKAATDTTQNKCHLSQRSYPYLIANSLGHEQYESSSCSGATIEDLIRIDKDYKGQIRDDIRREERNVQDILNNFEVGYLGQVEFLSKYKPKILTLSAVGNDIGFGDKIKRCLDTDTCYSSYEDRLEIVNEVNAQFYRLTSMYDQLKKVSDPQAKIYIVGYPQIGDPDGNCAVNVHLNRNELLFAQQLITYLNDMVKKAAANQGVFYVDVENAFAGHRLCETDSWKVAVNGLTSGNDILNIPFVHGPIGNESFHPNAFGHELFKTAILEKTQNLTAPMPAPNSNSTASDPTSDLPILNAPKTNRAVKLIKNVAGINGGIVEIGKQQFERISGGGILGIGSKVKGWIHSEPHYLGEFTVDSEGDIPITFTLPTSIPTGFHTLHFYGKNTSNEDVDFYMAVYVINGDLSECGVVLSSNQDSDKDAVDDACDPFIAQSPPEPANSNQPTADPKPPANNPETNTDNEKPLVTVSTGSNSPPPTPLQNQPISSIQPSPNTESPQVAAATTTQPPSVLPLLTKNIQIKEKFNNLLLLLIPTALLGLFLLRRSTPK